MVRKVKANLPTIWGEFEIFAYEEEGDIIHTHIALCHKLIDRTLPIPVRIHSECLTGDLFGSTRCDCGEQLDAAMKIISDQKGVLIYLRQEGRGIGLVNKLKAYNLQDSGLNTIDANIHLGFEPDQRDYSVAEFILQDLEIKDIHLITNNPDKLSAIDHSSITMHDRIPLVIVPRKENMDYLRVKQEKMGHLYTIED